MGLFSSTKIVVGSSAMHLVDASTDPVNDAVISTVLLSGVPYITRNDIPASILKSLLNSFGTKMHLVYDYAKSDYKLGLPGGEALGSNPIGDEVIAPYIAVEIGHTDGILVTDHIYTKMNAGIAIYDHLLNTRDYDGETNIINIWPSGVSFTSYWGEDVDDFPQRVTIDKIVASADKTEATIYYTLAIYRSVVTDTGNIREGITPVMTTEWFEDPNITTEVVPIPDYINVKWNSDCLFALYQKIDSGGVLLPEVYFWIYQLDDNLYPDLHPDKTEQLVGFLPVVPIRHNNVDLTDPTTQNSPEDPTNLYSTSKKLLKFLNIDLHDLGARINENPDIAEIDHAYVMWGVDLQTDYPESLYYLNEFFSDIEQLQQSNELEFLATLEDPDIRDEPTSRYVVNPEAKAFSSTSPTAPEEAFKEYGLILDLEYDFISSSNSTGIIGEGKIGYTEKSYETYVVTISTTNYDEGIPTVSTRYETRHRLVLRAQTSTNVIRTVKVSNPQISNWIYGNKHITTGIEDIINDGDNHNMIFPLQYNITDPYNIRFKSVLYSDSTILVINSINKIKLKWYQSSLFKMVIMAVAIIITVWSGGTQAWLAGLAKAATAGLLYVFAYIGISVLISMAISELANWIIEEYGAKIGIIGALVMMLVSMVMSRGIGAGQATQFMITTAQTMTQISTALISSANEFLIEEGAKIRNDFMTFVEEMEGLWEDLEIIQDLLENKADIDPLLFTKPNQFMMVPSENPTQFFNRCLGLVENTMFTIHDDIYNFMDMRLKSDKNITKEMQQMNLYG